MQIDTSSSRIRITAVLGPTNTGKTHLAMERLLGFQSGMIGFPLRLLARENYERAVKVKGSSQVALITGEEKIVPAKARYFICTVEAMPLDRRTAFLGIDEVQMCADGDRGHVFTDRLFHARGEEETMFMGAETIRPLLRRLVPKIEFQTRPRFSTLSYSGQRRITRLPPRSAVVAFSAADVYALAELIRRQRGGAAVVLGALSPRTRNAQVGMYQAGEVNYLVATDAIGMGLNMDVDHVAFSSRRKFDGRIFRELSAAELAQTAGRAGRHMNDGTFGSTADAGVFDTETVERIENHRFQALKSLFWRNPDLRFSSLKALQKSLSLPPTEPGLMKAREADDEAALVALGGDKEIANLASTTDAIHLLWEVCRIPDFRKIMSGVHTRLLGRIYRHLMAAGTSGAGGRLPTDWFAAQVARLDRADGDIETLIGRIAGIRIWTYVSFQGDWLDDVGHWRQRTRDIEDKLSDALHDRLTQRFVDRRTAVLLSRMKDHSILTTAVEADGGVTVEGHFIGHLRGFRFFTDSPGGATGSKVLGGAARRGLEQEITARVKRLEGDPNGAFHLSSEGRVFWRHEEVARLRPGPDLLRPSVEPLSSELLRTDQFERLRNRLAAWLKSTVAERLAPLGQALAAPLDGAARGLVFQLSESLGSMSRRGAEKQLTALDRAGCRALRLLGIRIGRESVFFPALVKPAAVEMRATLWALHKRLKAPPVPAMARVSLPMANDVPKPFYAAIGYRPLKGLAVRVDMLERLAARAWVLSRSGPFAVDPELLSLAGCGADGVAEILVALGYRTKGSGDAVTFSLRRRRKNNVQLPRTPPAKTDSPFAKLRRPAHL